jgi:hypothetical protein
MQKECRKRNEPFDGKDQNERLFEAQRAGLILAQTAAEGEGLGTKSTNPSRPEGPL